MSIQSEINRINNNVQTALNTIADTGVSVGSNSDALPAAAAALANEKSNVGHKHTMVDITDLEVGGGSTLVSITFSASAWVQGDEAFEQTVSVAGGTANSLVALQPTISQMLALQTDGVAALVVDNNNGVFVAKSLAAAPSADITMQATLTEVG
jgi:hypothetical protein